MLSYILYGLFIFACIVLVTVILLQPGKASAGALFSSGGLSSTAFGPRGTASVLAKITIGAAAMFMLVALMLSLPAVTGTQSLLQTVGTEAPSPSPAASPETVPPATEGAAPGTAPGTEGATPGNEGVAPVASPETTASPSE